MSFPAEIFDKSKQNCVQKCFYMMNLIRNCSTDVWEMYQPVFATLKPEESWEFYHTLIEEYKKLQAPAAPVAVKATKAVKKVAKKAAAPKKKAPAKKPAAKKTVKKK